MKVREAPSGMAMAPGVGSRCVKGVPVAVWVLLLLALTLRLFCLSTHGLWLDEQVSAEEAVGSVLLGDAPITRTGERLRPRDFWRQDSLHGVYAASLKEDGGNGILYDAVLHFWVRLFGTDDQAVRMLSALLGWLAVCLIWPLGSAIFKPRAAFFATAVAAFQPLLVRYSQETRPYSLALVLSLLATLCLLRIWLATDSEKHRVFWLAPFYGLLVAASLLTHYLTVYVFASHAVFMLVWGGSRRTRHAMAIGWLVAAALLFVWMGCGGLTGLHTIQTLSAAYTARLHNGTPDPTHFVVPATIPNILAGWLQVMQVLTGDMLTQFKLRMLLLAPVLLLSLAIIVLGYRSTEVYKAPERKANLFLGILSISTLLLATLLAIRAGHTISFQSLYAIFSAPFVSMLMGAGIASILAEGKRFAPAYVLIVVQAVAMIGSLCAVYRDAPLYRPRNQFTAAAEVIVREVHPGERVIFNSWGAARLVNLYLPASTQLDEDVQPNEKAPGVRVMQGNQQVLAIETFPR